MKRTSPSHRFNKSFVILSVLGLLAGSLTTFTLTDNSFVIAATQTLSSTCAPGKHPGLVTSSSPELRKLAEYEAVYGDAVADRLMLFSGHPATIQEARSQGRDMATRLKEFDRNCIAPLVIFEPSTTNGPVNFTDFKLGGYDKILETYFQTIKSNGVTSQMMGIWVPFPEANTPVWNNTNPDDFSACVTRVVKIQKKYFPGSAASILLNVTTYPSNDVNWEFGQHISLVPYVRNIPKGLLNSFGLQGFPWAAPANGGGWQDIDAAHFLDASLAVEAATQLGTSDIWFNTGTFGRSYANDPAKTVTFSWTQRAQILQGISTQAHNAQASGYNVAVNLFAEDKSLKPEAVDWSYWHTLSDTDQTGMDTFRDFAQNVHQNSMQLWLFDIAH